MREETSATYSQQQVPLKSTRDAANPSEVSGSPLDDDIGGWIIVTRSKNKKPIRTEERTPNRAASKKSAHKENEVEVTTPNDGNSPYPLVLMDGKKVNFKFDSQDKEDMRLDKLLKNVKTKQEAGSPYNMPLKEILSHFKKSKTQKYEKDGLARPISTLENIKSPYREIFINGKMVSFIFDPQNEEHMYLDKLLREAKRKDDANEEYQIPAREIVFYLNFLK